MGPIIAEVVIRFRKVYGRSADLADICRARANVTFAGYRRVCYPTKMLIEYFEKLEKSKVLPWVGVTPFVLIPVAIMFNGDVPRGIGLLAFFASIFVGMILGDNLGQIVATHILKVSSDIGKRLTAAFSAFGFGFVPALVGSFANANLGTNIGMYSIGAHFFWACFGAGIFFFMTDSEDKK